MVTYQELLQRQIIKKIETTEKEKYVSFHFDNYKFDLDSATNFLAANNTKYSVIAGYYAVLNVTLWYFVKFFNLKISEEDTGVHTNCLIVLEKFIQEKKLKLEIVNLLNLAKKEFVSFTILKQKSEETLPLMLKQSADKRKRYTYYSTERRLPNASEQTEEAKNFLENVVKPYIFIMEKLKC
ncbi:hypothetical protein HYU21_04855 [Candidatus Woesearchaeota archaeon]|nr:hypothetical protein [Candidatus Woesearchaeota archaeon]